MGMPGNREEAPVNPYLAKHMPLPAAPSKGKSGPKGEKKYDLGQSSLKGGIFGPPDTSASRAGGKQTRFNPASGTYSTNKPY